MELITQLNVSPTELFSRLNQSLIDDIYAYVKKSQNLRTLREETIQLVKDGLTTIDELRKISVYSD